MHKHMITNALTHRWLQGTQLPPLLRGYEHEITPLRRLAAQYAGQPRIPWKNTDAATSRLRDAHWSLRPLHAHFPIWLRNAHRSVLLRNTHCLNRPRDAHGPTRAQLTVSTWQDDKTAIQGAPLGS